MYQTVLIIIINVRERLGGYCSKSIQAIVSLDLDRIRSYISFESNAGVLIELALFSFPTIESERTTFSPF